MANVKETEVDDDQSTDGFGTWLAMTMIEQRASPHSLLFVSRCSGLSVRSRSLGLSGVNRFSPPKVYDNEPSRVNPWSAVVAQKS